MGNIIQLPNAQPSERDSQKNGVMDQTTDDKKPNETLAAENTVDIIPTTTTTATATATAANDSERLQEAISMDIVSETPKKKRGRPSSKNNTPVRSSVLNVKHPKPVEKRGGKRGTVKSKDKQIKNKMQVGATKNKNKNKSKKKQKKVQVHTM